MYISHKCTNVTSLLNLPTHPPISSLCVITEHQVELSVLYSALLANSSPFDVGKSLVSNAALSLEHQGH